MTVLGDLVRLVDCEHKTAPISPEGKYFAVGTPAMRGNVIDYAEARRIDRETFELWTRRMAPKAGDVLFAREAPVGPVVRVPDSQNVAPGQRTVLIRALPELLDERFLFYLLQSPALQSLALALAAGSTVPHLNVADVRMLNVGELPALFVQRAIGEVLGALDDKIAANRATSHILAGLTWALVTGAAGEPSIKLSDVASKVFRGIAPRYSDEGAMVLNQKCIRGGRVDLASSRLTSVVPKNAEKFLEFGDVLVNSTGQGTLGRVARWTNVRSGVLVDSHVTVVRVDPRLADPTFVGVLMTGLERDIESLAEGSTGQTELRREALSALPMRLPDLEVQRRVGKEVDSWTLFVDVLEKENLRLAATRDELLPLLMSGKITVKDAEKTVEEVV